jgi:FMN phosphatase YigB (HAD superfamily)
MTGGAVLRRVLAVYGLLDLFDVTVFSNEFGVSKPHPSIFRHTLTALGGVEPGAALHVGDIERLDVEGALGAGMRSALYAPLSLDGGAGDGKAPRTAADFVVRDWRDFADQLDRFVTPG